MIRFKNVIFLFLFNPYIWKRSFCAQPNLMNRVDDDNHIQKFTVPADGRYEITIGGAAGGGSIRAAGGKGGLVSGVSEFKKDDVITAVIGGAGQSVGTNKCVSPGGGGATTVFVKKSTNAVPFSELILIAPGGGGAGYGQSPINSDSNDLTNSLTGTCLKTDKPDYKAAEGRSYELNSLYEKSTFSYNPTNLKENHGCLGGYGGGGQGGSMSQMDNYEALGGGGGGGSGHIGGKTADEKGFYGTCTAGGPGKSLCKMEKCSVLITNDLINGHFTMKLHVPNTELPQKGRTNSEKPNINQRPTLNGNIMKASALSMIICTVSRIMWGLWSTLST